MAKSIKFNSWFKNKRFVVFAVAFMIVGGLFVYKSFAAVSGADALCGDAGVESVEKNSNGDYTVGCGDGSKFKVRTASVVKPSVPNADICGDSKIVSVTTSLGIPTVNCANGLSQVMAMASPANPVKFCEDKGGIEHLQQNYLECGNGTIVRW